VNEVFTFPRYPYGTTIASRGENGGIGPSDAETIRMDRQEAVAPDTGVAVSHTDEEIGRESSAGAAPRYSRRLSDKILIAFHHACDQGDYEVASQLLQILEMMLTRRPLTPDGSRRRNMESLVAAHERLWHLRHPNADDT